MKSADATEKKDGGATRAWQAPDYQDVIGPGESNPDSANASAGQQKECRDIRYLGNAGMVKEFTGLEALAIRLRVGDEFPYFATKGFFTRFRDEKDFTGRTTKRTR